MHCAASAGLSRRTMAASAALLLGVLLPWAQEPQAMAGVAANWANLATGPWNTPGNWDVGTVPGSGYDAYVNNSGTARVNAAPTANPDTLAVGGVAGGGTVQLNGGTLSPGSMTVGTGGVLLYTSGTLSSLPVHFDGGTFRTDDDLAFAGAVTLDSGGGIFEAASGKTMTLTGGVTGLGGPADLVKTTAGTVTLSGANTYTGTTTVMEGRLAVTGSLANNGPDKVFIAPDPDNNSANGAPTLFRASAGANSYAGLGSQELGGRNSTAVLLSGGNTSGSDTGLSMAWREPAAGEPVPASATLLSDILNLTEMANDGQPLGQTDPFVLQMSYDDATLGGYKQVLADNRELFLAWLDPQGGWENAVLGNFGGTPTFKGAVPWNAGFTSVGDWGVDPLNNVAWALLNHNSEFAVMGVPEPSTLVLLAIGAVALALGWVRRKARRA